MRTASLPVLLLAILPCPAAEVSFPAHPNIVDVTKAPYHAKGDGITDDTKALQQAINEHTGLRHLLYFPAGTYLVSATLTWPKRWKGRDNWGQTYLCGVEAKKAVIRLKDGTFTNPQQPAAMDSGAATVFLPGSYDLRTTVIIRGKVRRIVGIGGAINYGRGLKPDFRLADGSAPVVTLEHFSTIHGGLEVDTRRTFVVRSVSDCDFTSTGKAAGAEWFFEDVVTHNPHLRQQRLWARQLNIENEGPHLINEAGDVWILGYKTERGGTLLDTRAGGRSEVLGGFSYTTTAGKLAPMVVNTDSSVFTFFGEICFSGDPFAVQIQETRAGETRSVRKDEGHTVPYSGRIKMPSITP